MPHRMKESACGTFVGGHGREREQFRTGPGAAFVCFTVAVRPTGAADNCFTAAIRASARVICARTDPAHTAISAGSRRRFVEGTPEGSDGPRS